MYKYRVITKGAPDVLLQKCTKQIDSISEMANQHNIKIRSLENIKIQSDNRQMAQKALRVIAVAYKDLDILPSKIDSQNIENNLTFVGLIGMIDPPRD